MLPLPSRFFSLVGGRRSIEWNNAVAATRLAGVPVAMVFAAPRRYLVGELALGAIK